MRRFKDEGLGMLSLLKHGEGSGYSAVAMAFLGDAVFELLARLYVMETGSTQAGKLHIRCAGLVNARAQCRMYHALAGFLTEEEQEAMRRGRNSSTTKAAKNASVSEYRHATGLEALFGYLLLKGHYERIIEIFSICIEAI